MKIRVYEFLELGLTVVTGNILSKIAMDVAENHSIIDKTSTLFSSLPSFGVGMAGMTAGVLIGHFVQEHLKKNQTYDSIIQFDSVQPKIIANMVKENKGSTKKM